jgi:hypothetical protein
VKKGMLLKIIIEDNLFMLEFFSCFRIGVVYLNDESGKASSLILGIWKVETNITFALRKKLVWHEFGEA